MNPYKIIFNAARYGSLGWFNVAYRRGFTTYEIWRLEMDTVYAEPSQFIAEGRGTFTVSIAGSSWSLRDFEVTAHAQV